MCVCVCVCVIKAIFSFPITDGCIPQDFKILRKNLALDTYIRTYNYSHTHTHTHMDNHTDTNIYIYMGGYTYASNPHIQIS